MSIKKLSLAAAISIGIFTTGIAQTASAQDASSTCCPTTTKQCCPAKTKQQCCPVKKPRCECNKPNDTAYGVGAAGSFKAYGTLQPYGGNSADVSEISSMRSPVSLPTVATGALAAQGIYGTCPSCQSTGAAIPISMPVVTIQKQTMQPGQTGGAAPVQETISTPTDSNYTGGAASIENEGYKCVSPEVKIPVSTTGCSAPTPITITGATTGQASAIAPQGFSQPLNPSINAYDQNGIPTGKPCQTNNNCPPKHHWWQLGSKCNKNCPTTGANSTGGASVYSPLQKPMNSLPIQTCPGQIQTCPSVPTSQSIPKTHIIPTASITNFNNQVPQSINTLAPANSNVQIQPATAYPASSYQQNQAAIIPNYPNNVYQQPMTSSGQACAIQLQRKPVSTFAIPTVAASPNILERQVYDYPTIPPSSAAIIGGGGQAISMGDQPGRNIATIPAQPIASTSTIETPSYITGAASPCSCGGGSNLYVTGGQVNRGFNGQAQISIQSASNLTLQRMVLVPLPAPRILGAASNLSSQFSDISTNFWAGEPINKLASSGIISGFPDRTFKPNLPVSRAEFSTMLVNGLNLQNAPAANQQIFKDVPGNYWASANIDKAYNKGLVNGYPDDTFKPQCQVSRAEALTTLSKALPCQNMNSCEAQSILSQYSDGNQVPIWASLSVAKGLKAGLLQNSNSPNFINPNQSATRADVASMLSQLRGSLALEVPNRYKEAFSTGAAATLEQQTMTVPSINVTFNNSLTARASHVGDKFTATTLEPVTVNGIAYPEGSTVNGKVSEIVRPTPGCQGALKLTFTDISNVCGSSPLPKEIIVAQVQNNKQPKLLSRAVEFPFVWAGRLVGVTGRTVGGMTVIAGNSIEQVFNNGGLALGDLVGGNTHAAGISGINSAKALGGGVIDIVKVAISGAGGLFGVTTDELAFLTTPGGSQVAAVNPKEHVTIAFGCQ